MERKAEILLMPNVKSKSNVTSLEALDVVAKDMVVAALDTVVKVVVAVAVGIQMDRIRPMLPIIITQTKRTKDDNGNGKGNSSSQQSVSTMS